MLSALIAFTILVLVVGVFLYDYFMPARKLDRKAMQAGVTPGTSSMWVASAVTSAVFLVIGVMQLVNPTPQTHATGRHERLFATLEEIFGTDVFALLCLAVATTMAIIAFRQWRKRK